MGSRVLLKFICKPCTYFSCVFPAIPRNCEGLLMTKQNTVDVL